MINAVVIDFDDTLCLTAAACFEMENEVLANMDRQPIPWKLYQETWGQPVFEAIKARSPGIDVEEYKTAYHPVIKKYTETGKLDSIPEENFQAMDELIKSGKILMVLTSRSHTELEHLLAPDHLLSNKVEAFYYRDNMQFHKPDPRAFDELLGHHDLDPETCVYVGDSISDAEAAKKAGLHFIASLESGLRQEEDFDSQPVDVFVKKFSEVPEAVKKLEEVF